MVAAISCALLGKHKKLRKRRRKSKENVFVRFYVIFMLTCYIYKYEIYIHVKMDVKQHFHTIMAHIVPITIYI